MRRPTALGESVGRGGAAADRTVAAALTLAAGAVAVAAMIATAARRRGTEAAYLSVRTFSFVEGTV